MHWRTPITLAVLLVILLGAAWYGWQTVVSPATSSDSSSSPPTSTGSTGKPVCLQTRTYPKGATVRATSFRVNVFNAGGISGQAADVLASLHNQGFQEGVAANPPSKVTASNVSILTPSPNSPIAQLVAKQFKGKVLLTPGPNLAVGVDVVIGANFVGMNPSAPSSLTLTKQTKVCTKFRK